MSFVEQGRPNTRTADEILDDMMDVAEDSFGREFSEEEAVIIRAFYRPAAEYLAEQEQALASVLNSAQIEHAEGEALDLLAALIGVPRRGAAAASTRLQFRSDSPVTRDYTIPSGSRAQTDSADAVRFESDLSTILEYLDGFEDDDLGEYTGDTGDASTVSGEVFAGDFSLELAAASGSKIINTDVDVENGSRIHANTYLNADTVCGVMFGVDNTDNHYMVVLDDAQSEVRLEVVEGGSSSTIDTASGSAAGEWTETTIDWQHDGNFSITVTDSSDSEVVSFETSEAEPTFVTGGYGFYSGDSTGVKYVDEVAMSRVSVDATATSRAADTNVGTNTVTVLASSINGVDSVTNPTIGSGGRDEEPDDQYRLRAQRELGGGLRATANAIINQLRSIEETRTVTLIINDDDSADGDGRPPHTFEAVVDAPSTVYEEIAQTIVDTKAAGDPSVGGYAGTEITRTTVLDNEQEKDISFSVPTEVQIYVSCSLTKTETYAGDSEVSDNIVEYIGGLLTNGDNADGELEVGDNVVYNQIVEAIMDVEGVHDIDSLDVDTSSSPSGSSNITITDTETASADSTDGSISISSSDA